MHNRNYGLLVRPYDHTTAVKTMSTMNDIEIIYGVMRNRFDNAQFFLQKVANIFAAVSGNQLKSECYNCSRFVGEVKRSKGANYLN